jgi:hypothetical protein
MGFYIFLLKIMIDKGTLICGIIFTCIGLPVLIYGIITFVNLYNFSKTAKEANGTIVDFVTTKSTHRENQINTNRTQSIDTSSSYPKIRFVDQEGKTVEFVSKFTDNDPNTVEGMAVSVLYNPKNSSDAKWDTKKSLLFSPLMLLLLGLVFIIIGFYGIIKPIINSKNFHSESPEVVKQSFDIMHKQIEDKNKK